MKNNKNHIFLSRNIFALALSVACSLLLTACGGSGGSSDQTAQSENNQKQAPAATSGTTTTISGNQTDWASKYEMINGITVPPEPAPSINNATLAGVDLNGNGVRDDVERKIASLSSSMLTFSANLQIAKQFQLAMLGSTDIYVAANSKIQCLAGQSNTISSRDIAKLVANLPPRVSVMREKAIEAARTSVFVTAESPCD